MIGNTNCRFNALDSEIRCAINPNGPCEGCGHFEEVTFKDKAKEWIGIITENRLQFSHDLLFTLLLMLSIFGMIFAAKSSKVPSFLNAIFYHGKYSISNILLLGLGVFGNLAVGTVLAYILYKIVDDNINFEVRLLPTVRNVLVWFMPRFLLGICADICLRVAIEGIAKIIHLT